MTPAVKTPPEVDNEVSDADGANVNGAAFDDEPQVLDLTALIPTRRLVKLPTTRNPRGEIFELRHLEDFGIEMQQKLIAWSKRYQQLMNATEELSESQAERLRLVLDMMFETVLRPAHKPNGELPASVRKSMPDQSKIRVVNLFSAGPTFQTQEAQMTIIRRLVDRGAVQQSDVDQVMEELRQEIVERLTSES